MNSFTFCLSKMFFIPPSILNDNLAGQSILDCTFFLFSTLKISCHPLLACNVSAEKSADNLTGVPLYVIFYFSLSLAAFRILFNFYILIICLGVGLFGFMLFGILCTSCTQIPSSGLGSFLSYFHQIHFGPSFSLSFPSGIPVM